MTRFLPLSEEYCHGVFLVNKESLGEEGWSEKLYREELDSPEKVYIVAVEDDDSVIGFGGFAQVFDEGHIMNIAVTQSFRKKGIGTSILTRMIDCGKQRGINAFTLEVRRTNVAAISLYEKTGFKLVGVRKNYYGGKEDALIYWLYL